MKEYSAFNGVSLRSGEPFAIPCQLGYGSHYLASTSTVFGIGYKNVKVVFLSAAGLFYPPEPLFLTPGNCMITNCDLSSAKQGLHVEKIQLTPPGIDTNGTVFLACTFTDVNGQFTEKFNGNIAEWTMSGPRVWCAM